MIDDLTDELLVKLAEYSSDPLGFVRWAFPWGEEGHELEHAKIEPWQEELLQQIAEGLLTLDQAIQIARASGHGIGKSALVAWIILWAISTFEDTRGVVTANTETQLKTKTWVELSKWYRFFIGRTLFKMTATAMFSCDPDHEREWRIDMVPWSERNPEAFAGLHNAGKRILVVFDEASSIADVIWETTEGALTDRDTQILWLCCGNPTKSTGRFRDCFAGGRFAHRWDTKSIDSRTISFTDKEQIQRWMDDWGEDSDFVRVRVTGKFPRVDAQSFISYDLAASAVGRELDPSTYQGHELVIGVDVARFGDDFSIIYPRKGRDAASIPPEVYQGVDTMTLAGHISAMATSLHAAVVMVDGGGVGGGVVDRLRQLNINVMEVEFGGKPGGTNPDDSTRYANKRAEIWGGMRNWLAGGCIPERIPGTDISFVDELSTPSYGHNKKEEIQLESKQDMRRRSVRSPDMADALACTFAYPVAEPDRRDDARFKETPHTTEDYNPFTHERIYGDVVPFS